MARLFFNTFFTHDFTAWKRMYTPMQQVLEVKNKSISQVNVLCGICLNQVFSMTVTTVSGTREKHEFTLQSRGDQGSTELMQPCRLDACPGWELDSWRQTPAGQDKKMNDEGIMINQSILKKSITQVTSKETLKAVQWSLLLMMFYTVTFFQPVKTVTF